MVNEEVLLAVYANDWGTAKRLIAALDEKEADHWQREFPSMLALWWEVLLETAEADDEERFIELADALSVSLEDQTHSLSRLFKQTLLHAYKARFQLIQGHYISGISELNTCIDLVEQGFAYVEEDEAFLLTSGLYDYFVAYAYDEYPLLRPYLFFLPEGDRSKGLDYLKRCAQSSDLYLQTEARYFLMRIYLELEEDPSTARRYCNQLLHRFPENLLFQEFNLKLAYAEQDLLAVQRIRSSYRDTMDRNNYWSEEQRSRLQQRINNINP